MYSRRLHPRWIPAGSYLSRLPLDNLRLIERQLSERELSRLEEALTRRPAPRPRARGPLMDRDLLITECLRRGQVSTRPASLLQRLRAERLAGYAVGIGPVVFASYLEWLPAGLLDAYLAQDELVSVERALVTLYEPPDSWEPEDVSAVPPDSWKPEGAGAPAPRNLRRPVAGAPGPLRHPGREGRRRGQDRRSRRQRLAVQEP